MTIGYGLRRHVFYCILCVLPAGLAVIAPPHAAAAAPGVTPPAEPIVEASTRAEILQVMHEVEQKYGADAVLMEGHLLGQAIRSGSILAATISVPGFEEHAGKRYLGFKLDTGIVYNDRNLSAAARRVHLWSEIVEAALRKFNTLSFAADGVVILLGYTHKSYDDEEDLRAHLRESQGEAETAAFYLPLRDVSDLLAMRINAQQLVDRATILVDGTPTHLVLPSAQ